MRVRIAQIVRTHSSLPRGRERYAYGDRADVGSQGPTGRHRSLPQITNHQSPIFNYQLPITNLTLALDAIQDPGNLGTIIRTCDWFGVHDIFCSLDTADCYSPKVVQATMGALARVRIHYVDLPAWLKEQRCPIIGTLLEGEDMYEKPLPKEGIIVMGNEGNGISPAVRSLVTHPIRIPSYPKNAETSESLNVSIATAIVLAEFRRV